MRNEERKEIVFFLAWRALLAKFFVVFVELSPVYT